MSRIAAEELPTPVAVPAPQVGWAPQPGWAPLAAAPVAAAPAPARRSSAWLLIGGLAAAAAGIVGFLQVRGDDTSAATTSTLQTAGGNGSGNGSAGNTAVSDQQLSSAFTAIFGTTADTATISCISGQIGDAGSQAARLAAGETLTYDQALEGFVPFADCASDADFVGQFLAVTVAQYANGADEECVANGLAGLSVQDRANALALALTSRDELNTQLFNYFAGCSL
jgi:hypothetical protein